MSYESIIIWESEPFKLNQTETGSIVIGRAGSPTNYQGFFTRMRKYRDGPANFYEMMGHYDLDLQTAVSDARERFARESALSALVASGWVNAPVESTPWPPAGVDLETCEHGVFSNCLHCVEERG